MVVIVTPDFKCQALTLKTPKFRKLFPQNREMGSGNLCDIADFCYIEEALVGQHR